MHVPNFIENKEYSVRSFVCLVTKANDPMSWNGGHVQFNKEETCGVILWLSYAYVMNN